MKNIEIGVPAFFNVNNSSVILIQANLAHISLVTELMLQRRLNQTELGLMVFTSKFHVDSKNVSKKFPHRHSYKKYFLIFFPQVGIEKNDFSRSDDGGTFCLHFWNLHKIWI